MHAMVALVLSILLLIPLPALAQEAYKIGAIFSITGPGSSLGIPERDTALMLEGEINAKGGVDAWMPKYLKPEIVSFIGSRMGQDRAIWGTNGLPWKESLDQVDALDLRPEARQKLIRDNAREPFKL